MKAMTAKKTNKKKSWLGLSIRALALAALAGLLSGCMFDASIESLLSPPKLTEAQTAIYNALILNTGSQIELVYPRTGEYRSPFVLYDLDGAKETGSEEAVVFYRESSPQSQNESSLRINILDQQDGKWVSVCDRPLTGVDIDSVSFHSFFGSDRPDDILVSCSVLSQTEKNLYVLEYAGNRLEEHYSGSYSFLDIIKSGDADNPKLFLVSYDPITNCNMAYLAGAGGLSHEDNISPEAEMPLSFANISAINLYPDAASIQRLTKQRISDRDFLIFLDYSKGDNAYGSQVLRCSEDYLTQIPSENMARRINSNVPMLYSTDIDGDGRIDIPVTVPMAGYEALTIPEQMFSVEWYFADEDNNYSITKKFMSYVSPGEEYVFFIPVRWQGLVTAQRTGNTVSFFRYSPDGAYSEDILSICVSSELPAANEGWKLYGEKGSNIYIKSSAAGDAMVLTDDELKRCLTLKMKNE